MKRLQIDRDYLQQTLLELLAIPSPAGFTDEIVHYTARQLGELDIPYELTRRGGIRATLSGRRYSPDRAVVAHLDTLGAMVTRLKDNGRLQVAPVGTWSSRFAEGARVTLFTDHRHYRGTILPLLASGHAFGEQVDRQPVSWEQVELRVDEPVGGIRDLDALGINVGDFVAIDPQPEILPNGYVNTRYVDNKGGVAALLCALKALRETGVELPIDCHPLFTITEELGSGASAILHGDVSEMVSLDIGIVAPGQNTAEGQISIPMADSNGPYDYHLARKLCELAIESDIAHRRDTYRHYKSDSASAIEAGNDIRTAMLCVGTDASHGYERTHMDGLADMAHLIALYMQSGPTFARDKSKLGPIDEFPHQIDESEAPPSEFTTVRYGSGDPDHHR